MDAGNASTIVLTCLLLTALFTTGVFAPQLFWHLSAWRYRNAEAMEPTDAQYDLHRMRFAALLTLSVPPLIGLAWPGDGEAKVTAWVVSALASVGVIIAVIIIRAVVRTRSQRSRIDHERPSELSSEGYAVEWLAVGYTLFCTLLIIGVFTGIQSSIQQRQEARENEGLTAAERQEIEDMVDSLIPPYVPPAEVERTDVAVYTAVPEGLYVVRPNRVQVSDAGVPRAGVLQNACPLVGVVVVESSVNVTVGMALDPAAAVAAGVEPATFCLRDTKANTLELVTLPVAFGERPVLDLAGSKLSVGGY